MELSWYFTKFDCEKSQQLAILKLFSYVIIANDVNTNDIRPNLDRPKDIRPNMTLDWIWH